MITIPNKKQHERYLKYLGNNPDNPVVITVADDGLANYYFDENCVPHERHLVNRVHITRTLGPSTVEYGEGPDDVNLERIVGEDSSPPQVAVDVPAQSTPKRLPGFGIVHGSGIMTL